MIYLLDTNAVIALMKNNVNFVEQARRAGRINCGFVRRSKRSCGMASIKAVNQRKTVSTY